MCNASQSRAVARIVLGHRLGFSDTRIEVKRVWDSLFYKLSNYVVVNS